MVALSLRLQVPLAFLALALALPPAAALPDPDDYVATTEPLPVPGGSGPGPGSGDPVEVYVKDGVAEGEAEAGGARVRTGCEVATLGCRACLSREGSGPWPVAIGDGAEGIGAGVDVGWALGLVPDVFRLPPPILDHELGGVDGVAASSSSGTAGDEAADAGEADGERNQYGPYRGVFVNVEGHCYG